MSSAKFNMCLMLKSGKTYNINPHVIEGETSEEAATRMLVSLQKAMKDGDTFHTFVSGGTNKLHTVIRLDSVELAYNFEVKDTTQDDKEAAEKKIAEDKRRAVIDRLNELHVQYYEELNKHVSKSRPNDARLIQLQIEHYEILNQGEDWKKNDRGY